MIKTNIKMRVTPEQSAKVQEICFKNGINWGFLDDTIRYTEETYIFINKKKYLAYLSEEQRDIFIKAEEEEIHPELFIRTDGSCIEKEEFTYPMWFKHKNLGHIVRFDGLTVGEVVYGFENWLPDYAKSDNWTEHTDDSEWEQVENPNKELDKLYDDSINNGGKTDYYQLKNAPFPINDFDDFAEWRGLNGSQFNMGKAMWTFNTGRHSGTNYERDLNKIIHYANRELLRLKRAKK